MQTSTPPKSSLFYFGLDSGQPAPIQSREADDESGASHQDRSPRGKAPAGFARKHAREGGPNGASDHANQPAPKRSRKNTAANGIERDGEQHAQPIRQSTAETAIDENDAMDVSHMNGNLQHNSSAAGANMNKVPLILPAPKSPVTADADLEADAEVEMGQLQEHNRGVGAGTVSRGASEPRDQEQAEHIVNPTFTLTNGQSVGVQITPAKVADLKPETKVLEVADAQHVMQISWRPHDPTLLAASGEHFCGLWKVSNATLRSENKEPPYHSLVSSTDGTIVSAVAWEPAGSLLAVAVYNDLSGQLHIYNGQDVVMLESLPAAQKMITSLRWQTIGSRLVGFAYDTQDSSLVLWDLSGPQECATPATTTVPEAIFDIDWAGQGNASIICAAGEGVVYQCRAVSGIEIERKWMSEPLNQDAWSFVRCSWWSDDSAVAIAACADSATLWIPTANVTRRHVHLSAITALEIRPGRRIQPERASIQEFATASLDNTMKLWQFDHQANSLISTWEYSMGRCSPVLALSYSHDGFYVASASYDTVQVWNAEKGSQPVAKWDGSPTNWQGTRLKHGGYAMNGDVESSDGQKQEEESDHSLSWDADSKKLAFGLGNQVRHTWRLKHWVKLNQSRWRSLTFSDDSNAIGTIGIF